MTPDEAVAAIHMALAYVRSKRYGDAEAVLSTMLTKDVAAGDKCETCGGTGKVTMGTTSYPSGERGVVTNYPCPDCAGDKDMGAGSTPAPQALSDKPDDKPQCSPVCPRCGEPRGMSRTIDQDGDVE